MPFENGREEFRTQESVRKDTAQPGADGDSRPLDQVDDVRRCQRCGSDLSQYHADREVCAECGL